MSESFDAALVVTQRDALVVELAALKKHQGDTSRSLARSATATAEAQQERDAALATIARVQAILDGPQRSLIVYRVRQALKPAQDAREGTSKATKGETGSELHPRSSSPATVESKVGTK